MLVPQLRGREVRFHEFLKLLNPSIAVSAVGHFGVQREAFAEFVLQVLARPEAFELPVDHDGDLGTKRFALFHAVRGEDQRVAFHPDEKIPIMLSLFRYNKKTISKILDK